MAVLRYSRASEEARETAFIRYHRKAGALYAALVESVRVDGAVRQRILANLGRVLDKEQGIYRSRERGVYRFTVDGGYASAPEDFEAAPAKRESAVLDFGDAFALGQRLARSHLCEMISQAVPGDEATLSCLVLFRALHGERSVQLAPIWLDGSYAKLLFDSNVLGQECLRRVLRALSERGAWERYHTPRLEARRQAAPDIDAILTVVERYEQGTVSPPLRLLLALSKDSVEPLCWKPDAGTHGGLDGLLELADAMKRAAIPVRCAVLGEAYAHRDQMHALSDRGIPFLIHVAPHRRLHDSVLDSMASQLAAPASAVRIGDHLAAVACQTLDFAGEPVHAYACVDMDARSFLYKQAVFEAMEDKVGSKEMERLVSQLGAYVLLSSHKRTPQEILSLLAKVGTAALPAPPWDDASLLLDAMAADARALLTDSLQEGGIDLDVDQALLLLRNQKCKVFSRTVEPIVPSEQAQRIYAALQVACPASMPLQGAKPVGP